LASDSSALIDYQKAIGHVVDAYRSHLAAWYAMENRWPDRPFWVRRRETNPAAAASQPSLFVRKPSGALYSHFATADSPLRVSDVQTCQCPALWSR
jgi:hypothetical protein